LQEPDRRVVVKSRTPITGPSRSGRADGYPKKL
jgi:hypothetical protein